MSDAGSSRGRERGRERGRAGAWRRRPVVVLACLVAGGLLLATTTQPWVLAALPAGPGGSARDLPVDGAAAAAAVPALGLVAVAGAVALSLVRGAGRLVAAALVLLAGLAAGAGVLALVVDPVGAAEAAARSATGVADVDGATPTAWPLVALLPCLAVVAAGVVALVAGRGWGVSGRFEAPRAAGDAEDAAARAAADPAPGRPAPAAARPPSRSRLWDDLSEGRDPTLAERRDPAG